MPASKKQAARQLEFLRGCVSLDFTGGIARQMQLAERLGTRLAACQSDVSLAADSHICLLVSPMRRGRQLALTGASLGTTSCLACTPGHLWYH